MASSAVSAGLKELLWQVFEIEGSLRNGVAGPEQQALLEQRLQAMMARIRELSQQTGPLEDFTVPVGMLKHLDEGGFPDYYTAEAFKTALGDNQAAKGKVVAVDALHRQLLDELAVKMPEETEQYRRILNGNGVSPGQAAQ